MMILLVVLALVSVAAVAGTVAAVVTDGYGSRPDRSDRFSRCRPI